MNVLFVIIDNKHILNHIKKFGAVGVNKCDHQNIYQTLFNELKKLAETKISQMKEAAIKEIKDTSIKIAVDSVKKIISTSVDKNKLDAIFEKDLEEAKTELKKINS